MISNTEKGWICRNIVDLRINPINGTVTSITCEICGRRAIRIAHYIENQDIKFKLTVGAVCAAQLCNASKAKQDSKKQTWQYKEKTSQQSG